MAELTYKDTYTAKPGDIIVDNGNRIYVEAVDEVRRDPEFYREEYVQFERKLTVVEYRHHFCRKSDPGSGYSFPTDKDGNVDGPHAKVWGWSKRIAELQNDPNYIDEGIVVYRRSFRDPAIIKCSGTVDYWNDARTDVIHKPCDAEVVLNMVMTNTCDKCGADYSVSGQRLAPRSQWGWDTGESLDEILSADWHINDPTPGREAYDED